ncbi:MAG: ArdC-like ssDNA-binding domain-containing protein [Bacteroidales bacterium]|nr:ArdC-like ssDNA-binding domain-containing protein [Bacteroidales bacterium]
MNAIILEKRKALQTLSHAAQEAAKDEGINPEEYKVNELLMMLIYNPDNEYTFNSFFGWKREGYTIKKGSKAYVIWGQPINRTRQDQQGNTKESTEDQESEPPFFPLAYLFRSDQVLKPIKLPKSDKKKIKMEVDQPSISIDL